MIRLTFQPPNNMRQCITSWGSAEKKRGEERKGKVFFQHQTIWDNILYRVGLRRRDRQTDRKKEGRKEEGEEKRGSNTKQDKTLYYFGAGRSRQTEGKREGKRAGKTLSFLRTPSRMHKQKYRSFEHCVICKHLIRQCLTDSVMWIYVGWYWNLFNKPLQEESFIWTSIFARRGGGKREEEEGSSAFHFKGAMFSLFYFAGVMFCLSFIPLFSRSDVKPVHWYSIM